MVNRCKEKRVFTQWWLAGMIILSLQARAQQSAAPVPEIDGSWWQIAGNPDLGSYTTEKQQPVDFAVWQASDGTWQLWSCIRGTKAGKNNRLFYRWEGKGLTRKDWKPMGIAMEADTSLGEAHAGLQAPHVWKEKNRYYMVYGDLNRICLAMSRDGKQFTRVLNEKGQSDIFSGPYWNARDPMMLRENGLYYCYYMGHSSPSGIMEKNGQKVKGFKSAVFVRTSADLRHWSEPLIVSAGGEAATKTDWFGGDTECPFVVKRGGYYYLFRNQVYGEKSLNTQYASRNPFDFGVDRDIFRTGSLPVAAPEIVYYRGEYYIVALNPGLDGIRMAKLHWKPQYLGKP
jgi:hypothetical protein